MQIEGTRISFQVDAFFEVAIGNSGSEFLLLNITKSKFFLVPG